MAPRAHADEQRHPDAPVECWWWWGVDDQADLAWFIGLEVRGRRFDYWTGLARRGRPYLYVEELDGTGLRQGLELKPHELWADHDCEVPFGRWILGNEAYGVLLDDPSDVLRRPHGTRTPIAVDIEWFSDEPVVDIDALPPGSSGYEQRGRFDARVELAEGMIESQGRAWRLHQWGSPHRPAAEPGVPPAATSAALSAPYRRGDGSGVEQQAAIDGWWAHTVVLP